MIPKIKFDMLITIDEWAGALDEILAAAKGAIASNSAVDRIELQSLLLTYIKKSPPKVESLDEIARNAIEDLGLSEIQASLDRIAARSAELERVSGLIGAVTAEAKKDARTLQLEGVVDALTKAKAAVDAFQKLERSLTNPDEKLLARLKAAADAIGAAAKLT